MPRKEKSGRTLLWITNECAAIEIRQPIIAAENGRALVEARLLLTESHRFFVDTLCGAMNN